MPKSAQLSKRKQQQWVEKAKKTAEVAPAVVPLVPEKKPFRSDMKIGDNANVLLKFNDELRIRIDEHLYKLQELHYYAPRATRVTPAQFKEAQTIARAKGVKHANDFLRQCRAALVNPAKYKPSRHSFVYFLVALGVEAYEREMEQYQHQIIYGDKNRVGTNVSSPAK